MCITINNNNKYINLCKYVLFNEYYQHNLSILIPSKNNQKVDAILHSVEIKKTPSFIVSRLRSYIRMTDMDTWLCGSGLLYFPSRRRIPVLNWQTDTSPYWSLLPKSFHHHIMANLTRQICQGRYKLNHRTSSLVVYQ